MMGVTVDSYEPMISGDFNWTNPEQTDDVSRLMDAVFQVVVPPLIREGLSQLDPMLEFQGPGEDVMVELFTENGCLGRNVQISFSLEELLKLHIERDDPHNLDRLKKLLRDCLDQLSIKGVD